MTGVVCHVVDAGMGEVGQHIGTVQPGHGDLGNEHLQKGAEGGEDALAARLHAEPCRRREVGPLHDAATHEDFGVGLADLGQAARALKIAVHHQHLVLANRQRHGRKELHHRIAEHIAVRLQPLA